MRWWLINSISYLKSERKVWKSSVPLSLWEPRSIYIRHFREYIFFFKSLITGLVSHVIKLQDVPQNFEFEAKKKNYNMLQRFNRNGFSYFIICTSNYTSVWRHYSQNDLLQTMAAVTNLHILFSLTKKFHGYPHINSASCR